MRSYGTGRGAAALALQVGTHTVAGAPLVSTTAPASCPLLPLHPLCRLVLASGEGELESFLLLHDGEPPSQGIPLTPEPFCSLAEPSAARQALQHSQLVTVDAQTPGRWGPASTWGLAGRRGNHGQLLSQARHCAFQQQCARLLETTWRQIPPAGMHWPTGGSCMLATWAGCWPPRCARLALRRGTHSSPAAAWEWSWRAGGAPSQLWTPPGCRAGRQRWAGSYSMPVCNSWRWVGAHAPGGGGGGAPAACTCPVLHQLCAAAAWALRTHAGGQPPLFHAHSSSSAWRGWFSTAVADPNRPAVSA